MFPFLARRCPAVLVAAGGTAAGVEGDEHPVVLVQAQTEAVLLPVADRLEAVAAALMITLGGAVTSDAAVGDFVGKTLVFLIAGEVAAQQCVERFPLILLAAGANALHSETAIISLHAPCLKPHKLLAPLIIKAEQGTALADGEKP